MIAASLLVGGCQTTLQSVRTDLGIGPQPESATEPLVDRLPVAPAPSLHVGDTYVFRFPDGTEQAETVTGTSGDRVSWRIPSGATWTTVNGTMFNTSAWSGSAGYGSGSQSFTGNHADLFPLRVGNAVHYVARGESSREKSGWTLRWTCTAPSEERITVTAGTFETYRVVCYRSGQLRTYFYAPRISFYVLRVTTGTDPGRKELVSYQVGRR